MEMRYDTTVHISVLQLQEIYEGLVESMKLAHNQNPQALGVEPAFLCVRSQWGFYVATSWLV